MSKKLTGSTLTLILRGTIMAVCLGLLFTATGMAQQASAPQAQMARLPLAFEPNQGQTDPQVKFLSRGQGYLLLLTGDEAVLALSGKNGKRETLRLAIDGADRKAKSAGVEMLEGKTNYFLGNDARQWRTNIPNYKSVRYSQIYPGIDLLYYGKQTSLEHDFIVAPNADPARIALKVKGAKSLGVDKDGNLILTTEHGRVQLDKPFIYQLSPDGKHTEVAGGYTVKGSRVSFRVGAYDKSRELVIDPVLNYATYFGGDATTTVNAITTDSTGNAYITGSTASAAGTLSGTNFGAPDRDGTTKLDVFVAKISADGSAVSFTSILGGTGDEHGNAVAVDGSGNVYVAGQTSSANFPTSSGAYLTTLGSGMPDGFVLKLNSAGSSLTYSTYLNGSRNAGNAGDGADNATGVTTAVVNNVTHIIVVGSTASTTLFPSGHLNGTQTTNAGGTSDAFVMRLNPAGTGNSDLRYGTYFGDTAEDAASAVALVTGARAAFGGFTKSSNFDTSGGAADTGFSGTQDGFLTSLSTGAASITAITCVDNTADRRIDITSSAAHGFSVGDAFTITDVGNSANITFTGNKTVSVVTDATHFSYQDNACNNRDGQTGGLGSGTPRAVGRRNFSTFVGGNLVDSVNAVAVDGTGAVYLAGTTTSATGFPNAANTIQSTGLNTSGAGTETDAFVAKLANDGTAFTYSAYLGGTGNDSGTGIAVNSTCTTGCEAYVVGTTASGSRFNSNSLQSALSGTQDGFVARVNSAGSALIYSTYFGGTGADSMAGVAGIYSGTGGASSIALIAANSSTGLGAISGFGAGATPTSNAANTAPTAGATGSAVVARIAANNAATPTFTVVGSKDVDPIGQSTAQTSTVVYTWTVTNTSGSNAATNVTLDVATPQDAGADLIAISSTNNPSACSFRAGTATQPGGMTCVLGNIAAGNGTGSVQVTAAPTTAAHCDNAPCTVPTITLTGRANAAEPSTAASGSVVSNVVPVTDLVITGTAVSTPGGNAIYRLGTDTAMKYTITVTNNSGATIAANDAALDVLIESVYSTDPLFVVSSVKLNTVAQVLGPLTQGVDGCFNDTVNHKVQCNVASIAAGGNAVVEINGSFNAGTINPAVPLLNTTSKFPPSDTSEIFTSNANNTNLSVNVDYQGPVADLQITAFAEAGDPIRTAQDMIYTITVDNAGPTDATGVTVTLTPAAPNPVNTGKFTYAENSIGDGSVPIVCTQPGGAGTAILCPIANTDMTAAAAAVTFTVTGTLTLDANVPTSDQQMVATITTTGTTSDNNAGNSTANQTTTVRREAALSVSGFSAPATVASGASFNYTFNVANSGLDNATGTVVTLSLPQNGGAVTFTGNSFTNQACSGTTTVTCTIGTINAGASNIGITVTVTPATLGAGVASAAFNGAITNIASPNVVSTGGTKTAANILTTVQRQTTVSVSSLTNTNASNVMATTGTATYTVDVSNAGANAATNVKIDFTVPTGTTTPIAGCSVQSATVIRCNVASVPTGGLANKVTLAVSFTPSASFVPTSQSSATFGVSATFNGTASTDNIDSGAGTLTDPAVGTVDVSVERRADVQLFNLTATPTVSSDGNITVQAQVQNLSGATATNVQVVFTFNHNYRFVSANVVNANGIPNTPAFSCTTSTATTRTCTIPDLPLTTLYTFNVIVQPEAGIIATNNPGGNSTTVNVSATISASVVQNPNTGNDTSGPLNTDVQRQANLRASGASTTFAGPPSAINSSATATYNLTVRNDGPDTVDGSTVVFTFTNNVVLSLDTSAAAQTAWAGLGTCVRNNASTVTCTMAPGFATGARSGAITISPDAATLLASTNSAPYDVTALLSSAQAYDNGTTGAAGSDNATAIVTTTVQRQADLRVTNKTAPTSVADGGNLSYTITVQNFGPDAAGSVRLIDPLAGTANAGTLSGSPTGGFTLNAVGATFVSPTIPGGICTPNSGSPTAPSVTVVCMLGPLNNGESATITISGRADIDAGVSSATFNNIATVDAAQNAGDPIGGGTQTAFETNSGNNSNSVKSTTVTRSADLLTTAVTATPVLVGGTPDPLGAGTNYVVGTHESILYDIAVQNNAGSATTVTTASVSVTLPSTLSFSSSTTGCTPSGQLVTCPVSATLAPGDASAVAFIAVPGATLPVSGSNVQISITPSVGAAGNSDPDTSNNALLNTITIDRISDLGIVQTGPVAPLPVVSPGPAATFQYTWTVTNQGPSNATGVTISNVLPVDLQFVSGSWPLVTGTPAGNCSGSTSFGATITCNLSTVAVGASVPITVTVRPTLNTALANKLVLNQPQITGLVQDTVGGNNTSVTQVELRGVTDLQVTITPVQDPAASAGQVLVGNNQTWAVAVKNNGPYPAGGTITLTDTIDPSVALVSVQPAAGGTFSCVGAVCTVSTIPPSPAPGSTQTVNVVTTTPASAVIGQTTALTHSAVVTQYSNGTSVGSDVTDPTPANNTGVANVTGRAAADVGVSQTAPNGTNVGLATNTVKFRMQVSNVNGRSDATGVVLTNSIVINPNGAVPTTAIGAFTGATSGNCNAATGLGSTLITITCPLGTIPTGQTTTVDLTLVPVLDSGSNDGMTNTPSVTITEVDPVSGNNSAAALGIRVSTVSAGQQTFSPTNPSNGQPIPSVIITGFVSNPGATTMIVPITNPGVTLPPKYQFGSNNAAENYYQITNTTVFTGGIQLCILTPETFFQPGKARVFLVSGGTPSDVTTATGFNQSSGARQVCATVPTISNTGSTYVVMEPINTPPVIANATVTTTGGGKGAAGVSATLDGTTVTDPDSFPCVKSGVNLPSCPDNLIFRWVGNFTDITQVDPATGLRVIVKDCSQPASSFFDGNPCNLTQTSLGLGSNTVTLQVFDDFSVLNPPPVSRTFNVGATGGSGGSTTQTVSRGQTGTFTFQYTYSANTTFAFTGTPSLSANGITCSAQPLTYSGPVGGTQTVNVTVLCSTSSQVFASNSPAPNGRNEGSLLAGIVGVTSLPLVGIVLMPGRSRRRRMLKMAAIFALIALMVVFNAACGGGGSSSFGGAPKLVSQGTALGDYTITVNPTPAPNGTPPPTLILKVQ